MGLTASNWVLASSNLLCDTHRYMAAAPSRHTAVCPVSSGVKQRSIRTAGAYLFCLTLARFCSCSVRFGMWSGARRLIAACQEGQVLLLNAPDREEPLTAEDMLLNGANLVSIPATQRSRRVFARIVMEGMATAESCNSPLRLNHMVLAIIVTACSGQVLHSSNPATMGRRPFQLIYSAVV